LLRSGRIHVKIIHITGLRTVYSFAGEDHDGGSGQIYKAYVCVNNRALFALFALFALSRAQ